MANTPRYLRGPYCSTTPLSPLLRLSVRGSPRAIVSSRNTRFPPAPPSPGHTRIRSFSSARPISLREVSLARVYDRNSFTRSSPVTQRNERCFFAWLIREIKCARGQGISDGDSHLRSFLSLSLCLSFSAFASLRTCEHRSKRKPRKTRLFTLEKNLTTSFTKRLRIYAGLKDETRFNPRALLPSRCSDD